MGILELLIFVVLVLVGLWLITLCLRMGAGWAGISKSENTVGRALLAMFLSWLVMSLFGVGGGVIFPLVGNVVGLLITLIVNGFIIGAVYGVNFGKGVQIYVLAIIAQIVLAVVAVFVLGLLGLSIQ